MLDDCLQQALETADSIRSGITCGDAAPERIAQLEELIRQIGRLAADLPERLPDTTQVSIRRLLESLQNARTEGTAWLEQVAFPELEALARSQHGNSTYRQRGRLS